MSQVQGPTRQGESTPDSDEAVALNTRLRTTYASGRTRPLEWRHAQLAGLLRLLRERETDLVEALAEDLGRPAFESWASDLRVVGREIEDLQRNLDQWARPVRRKVPLFLRPGRAEIVREPLGVVLVIAPWNYPVQLLLGPVAAALAAGNAVVAKPSEVAAASSRVLARVLPEYLDGDAFTVVEGGVPETTALLEQRWDHIFFTGSATVGRVVAEAAARHLTPVTLELGGKCPVIVAADANIELAAARIAFSGFLNAGQACVGADHVYVHRSVERGLLDSLRAQIKRRYGDNPRRSDLCRIINSRHTERLAALLDAQGYELVCGGQVNIEERYVAPTVLRNVQSDAAVMREEIFGPILPVIAFDDLSEPIAAINHGDKPLALYLFSTSKQDTDRVLAETSSGAVCINDAISHLLVPSLPFGGVGQSGYGAYHGQWGFETFTHRKAVLRQPPWMPDLPLLNPPYTRIKGVLTRRVF
jgi:aldehyde dehydrogenase (NAD+)